MNEPQSVAAEILTLSMLAGCRPDGEPVVSPNDIYPITLASSTLWPVAPFSSLFGYQIPANYCMAWTYLSVYTTLANETETAVNYGFNYDALAQIQVQSGSGNFLQYGPAKLTQTYFNKPVLFLFEPNTTPRVVLTGNGTTQAGSSIRVEASAMAYLLPAAAFNPLKHFVTQIG